MFIGALPRFQFSLFSIGILLLVAGYLPGLTFRLRSILFIICTSASVIVIFFNAGYAPGSIATYLLLSTLAGLLMGRAAVGVCVVALPVVFVLSGYGVEQGWLAFSHPGRDPNRFMNWVRVSLFYSAVTGCTLAILNTLSRYISETSSSVKHRKREVEQSRAAMLRVREARITAEQSLRDGQKQESLERIARSVTVHFKQTIQDVSRQLSEIEEVSRLSIKQRRELSHSICTTLKPSLQIVTDLMTLSRLNDPRRAQKVNLFEVVEAACRSMGIAQRDNITLTTRLLPDMEVMGDQSAVQQAVLNLLLNAIDATSAGSIQVSIAYAPPDNDRLTHAVLVVEDTGHGISTDNLSRVLEPFFSTREGQTGLGLSVAHAIAVQNGGRLTLQSAQGIGTRASLSFVLRQPLDPATVSPDAIGALESTLCRDEDLLSASDRYTLEPIPTDDQPYTVEVSTWRLNFARRMSRYVSIIAWVTLIVHLLVAPAMHVASYLTLAPAILLTSWVGWSRNAPPWLVYAILLFGIFQTSVASLVFNSYDNPITITSLTISLSWSVLLERYRTTWLLIGLLGISFMGAGWVREHYWMLPAVENLNMNSSVTWYRMAPQLLLLLLVFRGTVVGMLERMRLSLRQATAALAQAEQMRLQEAQESSRLIAAEAHRGHQERMAATGRLAGSLAHDLRNTLQLILNIELIDMDTLSVKSIKEIMADVRAGLQDAETLIARLEESSPAALQPAERCLLEQEVRLSMRQLCVALPDRINVMVDLEPCGEVALSATDVRRLLTKLVNNARDAIPGEGSVHVTLRPAGAHAKLEIQDTGLGMSEHTRARIFDAYFSTRPTTGTGLGLHAVARLMSQCGGHIEVDSSPGEGSSFQLLFPVHTTDQEAERPLPERQSG